jgi:hypothetical protein
MVFERYRLEKQLRELEERGVALLSVLKNISLPIDRQIHECFLSKLSKELNTMFETTRNKLSGCNDRKCFDEVANSLVAISQYLATLEGETRHLRNSSEIELKVYFREIFECKENFSNKLKFAMLFQLCCAEVGLKKVEVELKASEENLQRLQASEGVHPCLYHIWEKLLKHEERLLSEANKKLTNIKEIITNRPCEALEMLSIIAHSIDELRSRLEEYKTLRIEYFSFKAIENFIPPHADKIFQSEEDVKQMLNARIFERLYGLLYRTLPSVEAERVAESLLEEYAKCIWSEIKR